MLINTPTFALEESLVVLNPTRERMHLLDSASRTVYEALTAGLSPEEITTAIAAAQGTEPEQAEQMLDRLLRDWRREGLWTDSTDHDQTMLTGTAAEADDLNKDERHPGQRTDPQQPEHIRAKDDFRLHDLVFQVGSGDAAIRGKVLSLYGHLAAEPGSGDAETVFALYQDNTESVDSGQYLLAQDDTILSRHKTPDAVILALASETAELWRKRRDWLMIAHAAAIAKDNTCILMPAIGGSGKSTLTASLICEGFTFLADDIVPILRGTGHAVAIPFCLHIKQGGVNPLRSQYTGIEALHPHPWGSTVLRFLPPPNFSQPTADRTFPITQLVFPKYEQGAKTLLRPISATEAFQQLLEAECMLGSPLHPDTVEQLVRWVQERPAYRLQYGCLEGAAEMLERFSEPSG